MPHKKGITNNPYGRPTGKPNKATTELRELMKSFIEANFDDLQREYDRLEGIDKFRVMEKFMQYIIPKYSAVEISDTHQQEDKPLVIIRTEYRNDNLSKPE